MVLILVVALLVFGPKRLPDLARSLGKGMAEFRRASNDLRRTLQETERDVDAASQQPEEEPAETKTPYRLFSNASCPRFPYLPCWRAHGRAHA